ncbi:MAG: hypothetical protein ACOCQG_06035 [Candidatus Nanoarchaeia archaeon]
MNEFSRMALHPMAGTYIRMLANYISPSGPLLTNILNDPEVLERNAKDIMIPAFSTGHYAKEFRNACIETFSPRKKQKRHTVDLSDIITNVRKEESSLLEHSLKGKIDELLNHNYAKLQVPVKNEAEYQKVLVECLSPMLDEKKNPEVREMLGKSDANKCRDIHTTINDLFFANNGKTNYLRENEKIPLENAQVIMLKGMPNGFFPENTLDTLIFKVREKSIESIALKALRGSAQYKVGVKMFRRVHEVYGKESGVEIPKSLYECVVRNDIIAGTLIVPSKKMLEKGHFNRTGNDISSHLSQRYIGPLFENYLQRTALDDNMSFESSDKKNGRYYDAVPNQDCSYCTLGLAELQVKDPAQVCEHYFVGDRAHAHYQKERLRTLPPDFFEQKNFQLYCKALGEKEKHMVNALNREYREHIKSGAQKLRRICNATEQAFELSDERDRMPSSVYEMKNAVKKAMEYLGVEK